MLRPVWRHVENKKEQTESLVKSNLLALSILYSKKGGGVLCKMVTLVEGSLQSSVLIIVCVCACMHTCAQAYICELRG